MAYAQMVTKAEREGLSQAIIGHLFAETPSVV